MTESQSRALKITAAILVAFGIGAGWQYVRAHGFWTEARDLREELTLQRLEATLATAAVEAQRGNHDVALRLASDFFTGLQNDIGMAPETAAPAFQDILTQRDVTIATLSRADSGSGRMLASLLSRYRTALGRPVGPEPVDTGTPVDTAGTGAA